MLVARNIARELLPLMVMMWATLAILGGAIETGEHGGAADEGSMQTAGRGLCAITLAIMLTDGLRKIHRPHKLTTIPAWRPRLFSRTASRPAAHANGGPAQTWLESAEIVNIRSFFDP